MRKVSDMTVDELEQLVEAILERKLAEYWGDPDEGLELTEWIKRRLKETNTALAKGERGVPHEKVVHQLGLERKRRRRV